MFLQAFLELFLNRLDLSRTTHKPAQSFTEALP
jgi:hypothetical protein